MFAYTRNQKRIVRFLIKVPCGIHNEKCYAYINRAIHKQVQNKQLKAIFWLSF